MAGSVTVDLHSLIRSSASAAVFTSRGYEHSKSIHCANIGNIRNNLLARIAEAEREGWTSEAEGLKVSLAAANNKLAQAETAAARRAEAIGLGIPAYRDIAAATLSPGDHHDY